MAKYGNVSGVPLSVAVFLATDHYDYNSEPNTLSATALLKPLRQIILSSRVPQEDATVDLIAMTASRMGTAIHDGIERAWTNNYIQAMRDLGIPQKVVDNVLINPVPSQLFDGAIPIYMEQRAHKKVGKYTISGKFDFVGDGRVEDFKSTSTYTAMSNNNDDKYIWQGSIYRWLNPTIITKDEMAIQFIFTDWMKAKAQSDPKYPQQRIQQRVLPLKSLVETDFFIRKKLSLIEEHWEAPEENIPLCTDEDLWRSEPQFKYYKNPASTKRSTKNFDTRQEAYIRLSEDGNVGVVREVPGQVTACKYCPAFTICGQKDALISSGDLLMG